MTFLISGAARRTATLRWTHGLSGMAVTCLLAGCTSGGAGVADSPTAAAPAAAIGVVAAENFWGDVVRQIGGAHVKVTPIITDPNADPHTYETDPKDAAAISDATFVVLNGAGYDDFAAKLLAASPDKSRTVLSIDQVVRLTGDNPNPHLWYNPVFVKAGAAAIEAQLAKADPAEAPTFATNEATFLAGYQPYVDLLGTIKARYAGTKIAYTERVPGYLVAAAGLVLGTPTSFAQSIEDGNDPSPADTATFDDAMTHRTVKLLLYNAQVTSPTTEKVKSLARSGGVPIVGVSETIPHAERDFQTWQIDQARAILTALGG